MENRNKIVASCCCFCIIIKIIRGESHSCCRPQAVHLKFQKMSTKINRNNLFVFQVLYILELTLQMSNYTQKSLKQGLPVILICKIKTQTFYRFEAKQKDNEHALPKRMHYMRRIIRLKTCKQLKQFCPLARYLTNQV